MYTKVPILKEVTTEKCNSVNLNTFSTYLPSLLGVIAEYNSKCSTQQSCIFPKFTSFKIGTYFSKQDTIECVEQFLLLYSAITPKSEGKYVEKVFNSTELHFSEAISFKIGTLIEY